MKIDVEYMLNLPPLMKMFLMEQCFYLPFSRPSLGCNYEFIDKCEECFDKIITGEIEDGEFEHCEQCKFLKSADALYACMIVIYNLGNSGIYDIVRGSLKFKPLGFELL